MTQNLLHAPNIKPGASLPQPEQPLIRLRQVTKNYRTAAGDFPALRGIDLDIYPGELVGILGKSGAGKTTLVNLISGVDHLTSVEVWVGDVAVHQLNENQAAVLQ